MTDLDDHPHALSLTAHAPGQNWWAECECGWISLSYPSEQTAERAHARHSAAL